jgi:AdoMet-dependent rRNA methyltransferase SPB1
MRLGGWMGKSKKTGRERLDKYYTMAKEKGYRARSAFKLLQLNKKYNFLANAHILVDLCAAPGGWLQVASQEMPIRRKIIGIDLVPVKYIGDVETLVCDITSSTCRKELRRILEAHKADVILHDGAPNVGTSWDNDAFNQNLLVLHALRLAAEFLRKGGIFVTKVFRSSDYDALLRVCNSLFGFVESTKPLSSRAQSAEIFVVCGNFVGEDNVNEELLEPSAVFRELRESGGCEFSFYKKITFTDLMKAGSSRRLAEMLSEYSEVAVDLEKEDADRILSREIQFFFKDLKVIGKSEIRRTAGELRQIAKRIQGGEIEVPGLGFLAKQEEEEREESEAREKTVPEKIAEIEELIDKKRMRESRESRNREKAEEYGHIDCFFKDPIFKNLEILRESDGDDDASSEKAEEISVSSCSDSLDLNDEELMCVAKLKDNPEEFVEDTIDRYIRDPDERLPNYLREDQDVAYARPGKQNEARYTRKELEVLNRRKTRAERRAEKFMANVIVDDSEEEGAIAKKIFKSSYKRTKHKPKVVFPKRGSRLPALRGKGRLVLLDRRMKKDRGIRK